MQTPVNSFKQALREGRPQAGLWLCLAHNLSAEICAGAGFDWVLVDGEHSPNGLESVLSQLQAAAGYRGTHAIARVPLGHGEAGATLIKQYLDIGAQTLIVPMVDTPEQAAALVRAVRYPPAGIRGIGGARASRWGAYPRYLHEANDQVCLIVQAETQTALDNLDAIAATDGVDGVFIGPADLSASLGYLGNPTHPNVQAAIADAFRRIRAAGKAPGMLTPDVKLAKQYFEWGAGFVAVGIDTMLLARHARELAAQFHPQ